MYLPPNVRKLDHRPTKKSKFTQPAPEVHIAVNIAPTSGMGGAAMQGSYVVSETPIPQWGLASAPGPSRPEQVSNAMGNTESCSAPAPRPMGRRVHIPESRKSLMLTLLDCTDTGRLPSVYQLLTLMDAEEPDEEEYRYIDACSEVVEIGGAEDALDIYRMETCYLATLGHLKRKGAERLRQYARDKILIPLGILKAVSSEPSIEEIVDTSDLGRIQKWRFGVDPQGVAEEIEVVEGVKEDGDDEIEVDEGVEAGESTVVADDIEEGDDVAYGTQEEV